MSGRIVEHKKVLECWGYMLEDIYEFLEVLYHVVSTPVPLPVPPVVELDQGGQPRESITRRPRVARSALGHCSSFARSSSSYSLRFF
jgi:hypothetical protein